MFVLLHLQQVLLPVYYLRVPFAGFQLKYTDIDAELQNLLVSSFDRLCKAENFDKTLAEINDELKAAGIDEYVAKVNQLLEASNAASNK